MAHDAIADWQCRVCGCTDDTPCIVDGEPCAWVLPDLCSGCVAEAITVVVLEVNRMAIESPDHECRRPA